jgi:hypothetical protein
MRASGKRPRAVKALPVVSSALMRTPYRMARTKQGRSNVATQPRTGHPKESIVGAADRGVRGLPPFWIPGFPKSI